MADQLEAGHGFHHQGYRLAHFQPCDIRLIDVGLFLSKRFREKTPDTETAISFATGCA